MDLLSKAKEVFGLKRVYDYADVGGIVAQCELAYKGIPNWMPEMPTINFTKTLCEETARLTLLGTSIKFGEGARDKYLQETIDSQYFNIRTWTEYAMAYGTVIIKPNGEDYDCVLPGNYFVTETKYNEIWGAIFVTTRQVDEEFYTRFEYHHFVDKKYTFRAGESKQQYVVENRVFKGEHENDVEKEVDIKDSPFKDLDEKATFDNVDKPLFAVLRTPQANNLDDECPFGLPLVSSALVELRDLDIAYDRMTTEIYQSKRTVMIDSDRLLTGAMSKEERENRIATYAQAREAMELPDYVKAVEGMGEGNFYSEINPTLNTGLRLQGINHLLSQIGYKIGFANGYFVFNEASGIQTATGVEANQQRTIQFIKDCRDRVEKALGDLVEAIAKFADAYNLAPKGEYEVNYQFGDITYNEDEDRLRWLSYANTGKIPFWYYLTKFEGFTEEDAKALVAESPEAQAQAQSMAQMQDMFAEE